MSSPLDEICCARIPLAALAGLAEVRCAPDVEAILDGDVCWLRWSAGNVDVLRHVLPLPGVVLYVQRKDNWHLYGSRLPTDGPPAGPATRLDRVILPDRIELEAASPGQWQAVPLRLARDSTPRKTTAMLCPLAVLAAWADAVSTARLASLWAAVAGESVLLFGSRLPLLPDSTRFWGQRVLVPLGFRPEPPLPPSALAEIVQVGRGDVALLRTETVEIVPEQAIQPVTRAGLRLACREVAR
jgi:hypothetical protein